MWRLGDFGARYGVRGSDLAGEKREKEVFLPFNDSIKNLRFFYSTIQKLRDESLNP